MHSSHRGSHHQPQVIHFQAFRKQPVLPVQHIPIAVSRKASAQAIAWFGRFPMADIVGKDHVVLRNIQSLTLPKKLVSERVPRNEAATLSPGAMQDEDSVADHAVIVAPWLAERSIVNSNFGKRFA